MWNTTITSFKESLSKAIKPLAAIAFIALFVQVFINAGMLSEIAVKLKISSLAFATPFLGAFGSFLTGSATVSNMLIAPILVSIDTKGINKTLALQLLGAAAGNMIALQNILTISAAVDSNEKEGKLLYHLLAPCIIYLLFILFISRLLPFK
jgi:lactate permease